MADSEVHERHDPRVLGLKAALLVVWAAVTFGAGFFARDLQFTVAGWPFSYWMAAQGSVLACLLVVVIYAWAMARLEPEAAQVDFPPGTRGAGGGG